MCIVLEGLQDRLTEPSESYAVMGEIVCKAELARFVGANPVAVILVDTTGILYIYIYTDWNLHTYTMHICSYTKSVKRMTIYEQI